MDALDDFGTIDRWWRHYESWTDRLTVTVRFVDHPTEVAADAMWVLEIDGSHISADDVINDVLGAVWRGSGGRSPFSLDIHERHMEWGASAALVEVVVDVAKDIFNDAIMVLLGAMAARIRDRLASARGDEEALVDGAVREAAIRSVAVLRGLPESDISVKSVDISGGRRRVRVVLSDMRGATYVVEVDDRSSVKVATVKQVDEP